MAFFYAVSSTSYGLTSYTEEETSNANNNLYATTCILLPIWRPWSKRTATAGKKMVLFRKEQGAIKRNRTRALAINEIKVKKEKDNVMLLLLSLLLFCSCSKWCFCCFCGRWWSPGTGCRCGQQWENGIMAPGLRKRLLRFFLLTRFNYTENQNYSRIIILLGSKNNIWAAAQPQQSNGEGQIHLVSHSLPRPDRLIREGEGE